MQTNGTCLDDEFCEFLKENNFLIGLSVDGPRDMHNAYRVDKGGRGSFDQVMRGWECLIKHNVEVSILCTVHAANADYPLKVYRFFREDLAAKFIQFIPIVERVTRETSSLANHGWSERPLYTQDGSMISRRSIKPKQYGAFLIAVFDEWGRRDIGGVFVQTFDTALANWVGAPGACASSRTPAAWLSRSSTTATCTAATTL